MENPNIGDIWHNPKRKRHYLILDYEECYDNYILLVLDDGSRDSANINHFWTYCNKVA